MTKVNVFKWPGRLSNNRDGDDDTERKRTSDSWIVWKCRSTVARQWWANQNNKLKMKLIGRPTTESEKKVTDGNHIIILIIYYIFIYMHMFILYTDIYVCVYLNIYMNDHAEWWRWQELSLLTALHVMNKYECDRAYSIQSFILTMAQ